MCQISIIWHTSLCVLKHLHPCDNALYRPLSQKNSIAVTAEKAEKIEEQVDEIEIEAEGAESCKTPVGHRRVGISHLLYPLCIPGGKADENQHACGTHNPFQCGIGLEDVDNDEYQHPEQRHVKECPDFGEVACGEIAIDAHSAEHTGCDKERFENRGNIVDHENH